MKSFRLAIFATIVALASATAALAAPAVVTTNVNVRSGPGQQNGVVDVLQAGTRVDAQCNNGGWCQVNYGRTSGWVSAAYVAFDGQATQPRDPRATGPKPVPQPQPVPLPQPVPSNPGFPGNPGWPFPGNPGNPGGGWFPGNPGNPGWPQPQPPRPPRPQPQPPVYERSGACFYSERDLRGQSFCLDQGQTLDRLPRGWNDNIRSVEVFRGSRVDLCSEQSQYGACITLRSTTMRLPNGIDRQASSIDVY